MSPVECGEEHGETTQAALVVSGLECFRMALSLDPGEGSLGLVFQLNPFWDLLVMLTHLGQGVCELGDVPLLLHYPLATWVLSIPSPTLSKQATRVHMAFLQSISPEYVCALGPREARGVLFVWLLHGVCRWMMVHFSQPRTGSGGRAMVGLGARVGSSCPSMAQNFEMAKNCNTEPHLQVVIKVCLLR